jgi:hypothetical protein
MLSQLRRKWSKLLRLPETNRELPVLRWQVERLEDRSMLSASLGPVPHGHGAGPVHGALGASNLHSMHPGAYAPPLSHGGASELQSAGNGYGSEPAFRSFEQPRMQDYLDPRSDIGMYGLQGSKYLNPNPYGLSSPPLSEKLTSASPTIKTQTRTNTPNTSLGTLTNSGLTHADLAGMNQSTLSYWAASLPPGTWNLFLVSPYSSSFLGTVTVGSQALSDTHAIVNPNQSILGNVGSVAPKTLSGPASSDLPLLSQLYLHDSLSSPVSVISAALRDIVFQGYLPNVAAAANANYDRTNENSLNQESGSPLPVDGFIQQTDQSFADIGTTPNDALTLESNAVNDILRTLREVEAPAQLPVPEHAAVGELNGTNLPMFTIDLQTDFSVEGVAAAQVDGGMVLLQSTGDANASSFDLAPLYAAQMDSFVAPTSMEASVGVYQAVDVAADESRIIESQPSGATVNSSTDADTQTSLPLKSGQNASHKAASVIGVTALSGAMVWMSRARDEADKAHDAAQKRHVLSA